MERVRDVVVRGDDELVVVHSLSKRVGGRNITLTVVDALGLSSGIVSPVTRVIQPVDGALIFAS